MDKLKNYLPFFIWWICTPLFSQNTSTHKVLVANHPKKGIHVKWLNKQLISNEGFYVYRKQEGTPNWVRLNDQPLKKTNPKMTLSNIQKVYVNRLEQFRTHDKALDAMMNIADNSKQSDEIQPIVLLTLNLKALEYNDFASYMGVYYHDSTAVLGKKYQYKIMAYEKQKAKPLALSSTVECKLFRAEKAVEEVKIARLINSTTLKWKHDPLRFFSVNILKKIQGQWQRTNKYPVPVATNKGVLPLFFYKDDSVSVGNIYEYKVVGLDFFGNELVHSEVVTIELKDVTPPSAPRGFRASVKNQDIHFTWDKIEDKDTDGSFLLMSNNLDGIWTKQNVEKISPDINVWALFNLRPSYYYFKLVSVDMAGNESPTPAILIKIMDTKPPGTPENFKAVVDTQRVRLSWSTVKETDIKGYNIYRSALEADTNTMVLLNPTPLVTNTYNDTLAKSLANTVYYTIRTVDTALNKSKYATPIMVKLKDYYPPQPPFIKSVIQEKDKFLINFYAASDGDTENFQLIRKFGNATQTFKLPSNTQNYIDNNSLETGQYIYILKAMDKHGNISQPSNSFAINFIKPYISDSILLDGKYDKKKTQIVLNWNSTGDNQLLGYIVFSKKENEVFRPLNELSKATRFIVDNNGGETQYSFQVRRYSSDGHIHFSNIKILKTTN